MHERLPKKTSLETIVYEIDMFRHCAITLQTKKTQAESTRSLSDRMEYYLGLEGFLLHLRNLLAFFTNRRNESTDIGINDPQGWFRQPVTQKEYSDLIKDTKAIDHKYGKDADQGFSTCYDQISKFLQHCTMLRHEQDRDWEVDNIYGEFDLVLQRFQERFVTPREEIPSTLVRVSRTSNNSTQSVR